MIRTEVKCCKFSARKEVMAILQDFKKCNFQLFMFHLQIGSSYLALSQITVEALLLNTPISGQLYFRPPLQNPVLLNSHTNSVFLHSHKRPAPVTDTFFTSQGCPLTKLPPYLKSFVVPRENKRVSRLLFLFFSLKVMLSFSTTHVHAWVDCKTVGFFLKISKEINNAWHMSANHVSLTRP